MKVIQFGYGKMGKLICHALKAHEDVTELFVYDPQNTADYEEDNIRFISSLSQDKLSTFDSAFIVTPAIYHFSIIEKLIHCSVKNIYVEKPTATTEDEFQKIIEICGNCKIVTGYILRQSDIMFAMKLIIEKMLVDGFRMELCSVTYQKYLPITAESRAQYDMGVFEEIVHVWDLLFNYLEFNKAKYEILDQVLESDPDKADRVIYAQISYYLRFSDFNTLLRLNASFNMIEKKREFFFVLRDSNNNRRHIYLSFDNADNNDRLIITQACGKILYQEEFPSLLKLKQQIKEVMQYFKTGEQCNLSLFNEASTVIEMLKQTGIKF